MKMISAIRPSRGLLAQNLKYDGPLFIDSAHGSLRTTGARQRIQIGAKTCLQERVKAMFKVKQRVCCQMGPPKSHEDKFPFFGQLRDPVQDTTA